MSFEMKKTDRGTFVAELPDGTGVHGDTEEEATKNLVRYLLHIAEHRGAAMMEMKAELDKRVQLVPPPPEDMAAVIAHLERALPTGDER